MFLYRILLWQHTFKYWTKQIWILNHVLHEHRNRNVPEQKSGKWATDSKISAHVSEPNENWDVFILFLISPARENVNFLCKKEQIPGIAVESSRRQHGVYHRRYRRGGGVVSQSCRHRLWKKSKRIATVYFFLAYFPSAAILFYYPCAPKMTQDVL